MTTRSARLWGPFTLATGPADVAVVPPTEKWIVKSVRFVSVVATDTPVWLTINGDAEDDAVFWEALVPAGKIVSDATWWVLEPGDVVRGATTDAPAVTIMASGARLPA